MKIILIDNSFDTTGASKSLFNTIREIKSKSDVEFVYIHPKNSKRTAFVREAGFNAYELPFVEIRKSIVSTLLYFPYLLMNGYRVSRIAKSERADLIHVNDLYNMAALVSKLFHKIRVVTHIRRMPESFPLFFHKLWSHVHIRFSDKIVAVSEANKNSMPPNNKTIVVYNPLPDKETHPFYRPKEKLNKTIRILYLANYNRGKGHQYAIDIVSIAAREFPQWKFCLDVYGGDFGLEKNRQYKRELEQMAIDREIGNVVHFNEKVNDSERIMKDHDLVLNLSDSESFSRLTLEALFYGVPVIATDVGGTREMLIDRRGGLLAPAKDVAKMYEAFRFLLQHDELRVSYCQFSYQYVRQQFNMEKTSEKIMSLYREMTGIVARQRVEEIFVNE